MREPTVDLGAISLTDAKATRLALQLAIDDGYFTEAETYAAVIAVKAMLTYRIALAEKDTSPATIHTLTEPYRRRVAAERDAAS